MCEIPPTQNQTNIAYVVNIKYVTEQETQKKPKGKKPTVSDTYYLTIPEKILKLKNKVNQTKYFDTIESYVYNTVTKLTKRKVAFCQIYLDD